MLTHKFLDQQIKSFELMHEVERRMREQGLDGNRIHDFIMCSAADVVAINKIFKEVQHDLRRDKAVVKTS